MKNHKNGEHFVVDVVVVVVTLLLFARVCGLKINCRIVDLLIDVVFAPIYVCAKC